MESTENEKIEPDAQELAAEDNPPVIVGTEEEPQPEVSTSGTEELDQLRDRYLRIAAEYENFRKRTARERAEAWNRAQADVVGKLLGGFDDLQRVSDLDPNTATAKDVIQGVELVERKLFKDLEAAGLERVGAVGDRFDPNQHEAVGMLPADSEEEDQTVGAVFQPGYRLGDALVRPAKVQVRVWQGTPDGDKQ